MRAAATMLLLLTLASCAGTVGDPTLLDSASSDHRGLSFSDVASDLPDATSPHDARPPDVPAASACTNAADEQLLATPEQRDAVAAAAQACGLSCMTDPDRSTCAHECVIEQTHLSASCAGCYAEAVTCTLELCLLQCAANPSSEPCTACQEQHCLAAFHACSGI